VPNTVEAAILQDFSKVLVLTEPHPKLTEGTANTMVPFITLFAVFPFPLFPAFYAGARRQKRDQELPPAASANLPGASSESSGT
jgi:hypothetical protein